MPTAIQLIVMSHRRPGRVTTHRHVDGCKVLVPESQVSDYNRLQPDLDVISHPDSVVGLCAKRQWSYEHFGDQMQLDDDSSGLHRMYTPRKDRKRARVSAARAAELIHATANTAKQLGCYLFGFGSHVNQRAYVANRPFKMGGYSPGGAIGILAGSKLWWPKDVTLPIDDYWICLLNSFYHRFAWYDKRFVFGFKDTYTGAGGMSEFRTDDTEKQATAYLKRHFGACVTFKTLHRQLRMSRKNPSPRQIVLPYRM